MSKKVNFLDGVNSTNRNKMIEESIAKFDQEKKRKNLKPVISNERGPDGLYEINLVEREARVVGGARKPFKNKSEKITCHIHKSIRAGNGGRGFYRR